MAEITTTQSFADGDTVTAAKLNNILGNSSISSEIITNRAELTVVDGANDFVLGYDTSASSLRKVKANNLVADASISTNKIENLAVTTGKINDLAVTTVKINDLAVTTGKIADGSITAAKIPDSSITTAKLNDGLVTTAKISDGAVTTQKIGTLSPNPEGTYGGSQSIPTIVVNSSGQVTSVSGNAVSSGFQGIQLFSSSGTFTVPSGVTKIKATCIGGGGGSGGYASTSYGAYNGGAGGGGGASIKIFSVSAGSNISVTVGAGGAAGSNVGASVTAPSGGSGGTSSFSSISATGGSGGGGAFKNSGANSAGSTGGDGSAGSGSGGDVNLSGTTNAFGRLAGLQFGGFGCGALPNSSAGNAGCVIVEW